MYEAVDMGPAAILEVLVLPRTKQLTSDRSDTASAASTMKIRGMTWKPKEMFAFQALDDDGDRVGRVDKTDDVSNDNGWGSASYMSGSRKNDAFRSDFRSAVGGLQPQIDAIVRRVLDGRVLRPPSGLSSNGDDDGNDSMVAATAAEARELQLLGLSPVRGLLLYGPPGYVCCCCCCCC
jgi:hypothetical protein